MSHCKDCRHWEPWSEDKRPMSVEEGFPGAWGDCEEPNRGKFARGDDPFSILSIVRDVFGCVLFEPKQRRLS